MKRTLLLYSFLTIALTCYNQETKIGVFMSPEVSWLQPDNRNIEFQGAVPGFSGGLILDKYFQKNYAISTGISIGSQGGALSFSDTTEFTTPDYDEDVAVPPGSTVTYRINYVTIPVNLKLKTKEIGYFSYYARLGFTGQIKMKAYATTSETDILDKSNISEDIKFFNLGYNFGGGIEYSLGGSSSVLFGIDYVNGFTDVAKSNGNTSYSRGVALHIGIIF